MAEDESPIQGFHSLSVGELFDIDFQGRELIRYNHNQCGHLLTVAVPNMTEPEEQELRSGKAQFALTVKNGIIFLLSKFGTLPWMDAPFQWWLTAPAQRTLPPALGSNESILLVLTTVDSVTNRIRVLRLVTLSCELSRALHEAIRRQAHSSWEGAAKNARQVAKIYDRYSTRNLLSQAIAVSDGTQENGAIADYPGADIIEVTHYV